ncbi:MAG: class I SAM-dependent methyltransferase [Caldimonas sp.]
MERPRRSADAAPAPAGYAGPERRRFVNRSWPLPAFAAWAVCWIAFAAVARTGFASVTAFVVAGGLGAVLALLGATPWRRVFIGCGFPLSFAASGSAGTVPPWVWLLPLALLVFVYPWRAWRDAPLFPTPSGALRGLAPCVPLADGAAVLDAGCGLGAGLLELHSEYPRAMLAGIEWSWPLRLACAWRCRFARILRGDMWSADWSEFDLVYLFQRPESMVRAAAKARHEMRAGAWLASLEFEVAGWLPTAVFTCADQRPLWLYRFPRME